MSDDAYNIRLLYERANEVNALIYQMGQAGHDHLSHGTKPGWWRVNLRTRTPRKGKSRYDMHYAIGWGPTPRAALEAAILEWLTPWKPTPKPDVRDGGDLLKLLGL